MSLWNRMLRLLGLCACGRADYFRMGGQYADPSEHSWRLCRGPNNPNFNRGSAKESEHGK